MSNRELRVDWELDTDHRSQGSTLSVSKWKDIVHVTYMSHCDMHDYSWLVIRLTHKMSQIKN